MSIWGLAALAIMAQAVPFAPAAPAPAPIQQIEPVRIDFDTTPPGPGVEQRPPIVAGDVLFVPVPDGNYRVTMTLGDKRKAGATTVKAEARRLMLEKVATAPGKFVTRSFTVNVRGSALEPLPPKAPGGSNVRLKPSEDGSATWDNALTLQFLGTPAIASLEIAPVTVPVVFLVGDSTVTDWRFEPSASWGQMFTRMFTDGVAIANHAESGETLKSFLTALRFDKVLGGIRAGDYLFIQFGHNDQRAAWPQTYVDPATYSAYLRVYIAEARRRGATPVLVTSPERRAFDANGKIQGMLGPYVAAMKAVAVSDGVTLIDLNGQSRAIYEALGPARAPLAFDKGGKDATHNNNYGAYVLARAVAEGIRESGLPLAAYLAPDLPAFDPAHPPAPEAFDMPSSR